MNRIVIELCAEDRSRLDAITAALRELSVAPVVAAPAPAVEEHPIDAPVTHFEAPTEPLAPAPEVKPVSLGEFQKAIVTRCAESAAMKSKAQALVHQYARSVSEIPEGQRAEVLAELAKL